MDFQSTISIAVIVLQLAGVATLVLSRVSNSARIAAIAETMLVVAMAGLGAATLIGAAMHTGSALTSGATIVVLAVAMLAQPRAGSLVDPYAAMYQPAEE